MIGMQKDCHSTFTSTACALPPETVNSIFVPWPERCDSKGRLASKLFSFILIMINDNCL